MNPTTRIALSFIVAFAALFATLQPSTAEAYARKRNAVQLAPKPRAKDYRKNQVRRGWRKTNASKVFRSRHGAGRGAFRYVPVYR